MERKVINVAGAPPLPFSPAIKAGDYIFVSGQVGHVDAQGKELRGVPLQVRQCLENMKRVLEAAGASMEDVVKVTVFLRSEADFAKMNEVYRQYFTNSLPARSTVIAGLALPAMLVEIDAIAYSPGT